MDVNPLKKKEIFFSLRRLSIFHQTYELSFSVISVSTTDKKKSLDTRDNGKSEGVVHVLGGKSQYTE